MTPVTAGGSTYGAKMMSAQERAAAELAVQQQRDARC
jgi:hypothetical protein